jgi:hypothetical protein
VTSDHSNKGVESNTLPILHCFDLAAGRWILCSRIVQLIKLINGRIRRSRVPYCRKRQYPPLPTNLNVWGIHKCPHNRAQPRLARNSSEANWHCDSNWQTFLEDER